MIPYVVFESFQLGPLVIRVWGTFVAAGILCGTLVAARRARQRGVDPAHVYNLAFWVVILGFLGARLLFLVEEPSQWTWQQILRVQDGGLSAFGAVLGMSAAVAFYSRRHRLPGAKMMDVMLPPLLLGEGIGRLGCFAVHEHLGRITSVPWAINVFGQPRHEVGLYLSLAGFAGWTLLTLLERRSRWVTGVAGLLTLLWYSVTRLALDTLRATDLPVSDARYAGLTLAQYFAIAGVVVMTIALWRVSLVSRAPQTGKTGGAG